MAGFTSQAYLSDSFRRQSGVTPVQYRKQNRMRLRGYT
jgi:AraC-like DNA-binding protein